jgi:hypothetical protein
MVTYPGQKEYMEQQILNFFKDLQCYFFLITWSRPIIVFWRYVICFQFWTFETLKPHSFAVWDVRWTFFKTMLHEEWRQVLILMKWFIEWPHYRKTGFAIIATDNCEHLGLVVNCDILVLHVLQGTLQCDTLVFQVPWDGRNCDVLILQVPKGTQSCCTLVLQVLWNAPELWCFVASDDAGNLDLRLIGTSGALRCP